MLEFDTSFHTRVRKLKSPTSAAFDAKAWRAARDEADDFTESDTYLLAGALWVASQSAALRSMPPDPDFDALDAGTAVMLAVATINREFLTTRDLYREATAQDDGAVSFGHIVSKPFHIGSTGQSVSADDVVEAAVDAAESWLFDAYAKEPTPIKITEDLAPVASRTMMRYSIQHALNDVWNQCYWEGWRLVSDGGRLVWVPSDRELATRLEAARVRQSENFMNYPFIDMSAWSALKPEQRQRLALQRTVIAVATERRRKIRVGRPSCRSRRPPHFLVERAGLEGSYLNFLLDRKFPNDERLTCRLILQAWHVILDLALAFAKSQRLDGSFTLSEMRRLALLVSRTELLNVMVKALGVDNNTALAVIEFLSFRLRASGDKGHRGLWAAPIVSIPGEDRLALALPVLTVSNPLRKAEAWLEKGGIGDSLSKNARGELFEADYRKHV
jgi:hypothetical protein